MSTEPVQIGDPLSNGPVVSYEKLEEVFDDIRSHAPRDRWQYKFRS